MIHPYMPFVTEELWQRLPRRPGDETPSIVKAAYPQYDAALDDPDAEAAYELVMGVSKGVRSLMAEYSIREAGDGELSLSISQFCFLSSLDLYICIIHRPSLSCYISLIEFQEC